MCQVTSIIMGPESTDCAGVPICSTPVVATARCGRRVCRTRERPVDVPSRPGVGVVHGVVEDVVPLREDPD